MSLFSLTILGPSTAIVDRLKPSVSLAGSYRQPLELTEVASDIASELDDDDGHSVSDAVLFSLPLGMRVLARVCEFAT